MIVLQVKQLLDECVKNLLTYITYIVGVPLILCCYVCMVYGVSSSTERGLTRARVRHRHVRESRGLWHVSRIGGVAVQRMQRG